MKKTGNIRAAVISTAAILILASPAAAHKLRVSGEAVAVADSGVTVTPGRDWNRLDAKAGKNTETWTLDGEQLNDVTFFGGIEAGKPLVKERDKKRDPLPKFTRSTLLVEIPELLEGTYRTHKQIGAFRLLTTEPVKFLDHDAVSFTYEYVDADLLTGNYILDVESQNAQRFDRTGRHSNWIEDYFAFGGRGGRSGSDFCGRSRAKSPSASA